jgi:small subunit ribosomal protein S16
MLMIRLRRMGGRNNPLYRVVVSDSRLTPRGSAVEELGSYNPHQDPPSLTVNRERLDHWIKSGAHLSPTVEKLLAARG